MVVNKSSNKLINPLLEKMIIVALSSPGSLQGMSEIPVKIIMNRMKLEIKMVELKMMSWQGLNARLRYTGCSKF